MRSTARQIDLFEPLPVKVEQSIRLIRAHEPEGEYYGAFSGGKDSVVIKELARMAGVRVSWHYNQTTIDPPELVRFIKREHPNVELVRPKHGNFFARIEAKGFPTRINRWCCAEYKEGQSPRGATLLFGVRAAESSRRARTWQAVTMHRVTKSWAVAPILYWSDEDVWQFIHERRIAYCSLYDEGFTRLGCIGCPMASSEARKAQFARWPGFERGWKRGFRRLWERRSGTFTRHGEPWFGDLRFKSWQEMWEWWLSNESLPDRLDAEEDSCQLALDFFSGGQDA